MIVTKYFLYVMFIMEISGIKNIYIYFKLCKIKENNLCRVQLGSLKALIFS